MIPSFSASSPMGSRLYTVAEGGVQRRGGHGPPVAMRLTHDAMAANHSVLDLLGARHFALVGGSPLSPSLATCGSAQREHAFDHGSFAGPPAAERTECIGRASAICGRSEVGAA